MGAGSVTSDGAGGACLRGCRVVTLTIATIRATSTSASAAHNRISIEGQPRRARVPASRRRLPAPEQLAFPAVCQGGAGAVLVHPLGVRRGRGRRAGRREVAEVRGDG